MTDDTYRDDDEKEEKREKKDEKKDDKKSVAYTGAAPVPVLQERRGLPAGAVREEGPHPGGARGGQSHPHRAPQRGARAAEADRPRGPGASRCVLFPYPRSIPWLLFRSSEWNAVSLLIYICLYGDLSNDVLLCCCLDWSFGATVPKSMVDNEYATASVREPKVLLTTSRNPSAALTQFVKVFLLS